jgi:post-segregation antitoxin (ccd killing protein)
MTGATVKTSVTLPRHLVDAARARGLNVSEITRRALQDELALVGYEQLAAAETKHPDASWTDAAAPWPE